jgi:hypothetical protein
MKCRFVVMIADNKSFRRRISKVSCIPFFPPEELDVDLIGLDSLTAVQSAIWSEDEDPQLEVWLDDIVWNYEHDAAKDYQSALEAGWSPYIP